MTRSNRDFNRPTALAGQFLPPLVCLWPILAGNDAWLYSGAAFALLIVLISSASLALRIKAPATRRGRMLRPFLAIALSILVLVHAYGERDLTRRRLNGLAVYVQDSCRQLHRCPARIAGWQDGSGRYASSLTEGGRMTHRYLYAAHDGEFELRLDIGAGIGESVRGGVRRELKPIGTLPWL